jgi:hypothetical protein
MTLGARGDNTWLREDLNHIRKGTPEKSEPEKAHEGLGQVTQTLENTDGGEIRPPPLRCFDKETPGWVERVCATERGFVTKG